MKTSNLQIELFGKILESPLIVGSGTLVECYEQIQPFISAGVGLVVPRTTRKVMHRKTHPVPHLYQTGTRKYPILINAEWTGADIAYWRPYLKKIVASDKVVMSVSGRDISECVEVCLELEEYGYWAFYEINLSCAHSNSVHGMITRSKEHIKNTIGALKKAGIKTPIAIKLGHSDHILELSCVAEEAGADALVLLNTYGPVFDFSINKNGLPEPILGIAGGMGGLSGASLFHIALTDIVMIKKSVKIPIIGCGGVCKAEDAIKMLMAGASAVQVYTAAHARGTGAPQFFSKMNDDILTFLQNHSISDISSIIGSAVDILNQDTVLEVDVPSVNENTCIGCNLCIPVCLPQAISIKEVHVANKHRDVVQINNDICIGCGHCLHVCPTNPNSLEMASLKKHKNIIEEISCLADMTLDL